VGRLVSGQPDESHLRLRQQVERRLGHAQAGSQYRHQQRGVGERAARRRPDRGDHPDIRRRQVASGLVDKQGGQLPERGAKLGVAAALVTHDREPRPHDGVIDDDGLHEGTLSASDDLR
jgi:hypothetical protein